VSVLKTSNVSYPQLGQILQFRQVGQLQIQRVDDHPAINRTDYDETPHKGHQNVVGKDQVVDNRKEQEGQQSENRKHCESPQPWHNFVLVFLSQGMDQHTCRYQDDKATDERKQGKYNQGVAYMRVSHVDKFIGNDVVAIVSRAWSGHSKAVDVKD
jgi:hypothetical protein